MLLAFFQKDTLHLKLYKTASSSPSSFLLRISLTENRYLAILRLGQLHTVTSFAKIWSKLMLNKGRVTSGGTRRLLDHD